MTATLTDDVDVQAEALWQAITFISVAQLYLVDNPFLDRPLVPEDVRAEHSGHWGTVPGTAMIIANWALAAAQMKDECDLVIGPGHAGVAQMSYAWLTGGIANVRPEFSRTFSGLKNLISSFPDLNGLGSEVSPNLDLGTHVGGLLGHAFAVAAGLAMRSEKLVFVSIGDGELETPTTAATWIAARQPGQGRVVPIVQLNGYRMGGPAIFSGQSDSQLDSYFLGLGWLPIHVKVADGGVDDHEGMRVAINQAVELSGFGKHPVILQRCEKGWGGAISQDASNGNVPPGSHKAPRLNRLRASDLRSLEEWLRSYHPERLFDVADGEVVFLGALRLALEHLPGPNDKTVTSMVSSSSRPGHDFSSTVLPLLRSEAKKGDFHLFSPDELTSNLLGEIADESWVSEILAEEIVLDWFIGWTASGRRGLLVSYEGFASIMAPGLIALLKQRRQMVSNELPSINLLLTSYGWQNTYSHGDPSLSTTLLGLRDDAVRVYVPSTLQSLAETLIGCLNSVGRINLIVFGKRTSTEESESSSPGNAQLTILEDTLDSEEPSLVVAFAGDIPAKLVAAAIPTLRAEIRERVRVVRINELTTIGDSRTWSDGLQAGEIPIYFGHRAEVLFVTLGHPAAIWSLLEGRLGSRAHVLGWLEPAHPGSQLDFANHSSMTIDGVAHQMNILLGEPVA